jgi:hypothetical protein
MPASRLNQNGRFDEDDGSLAEVAKWRNSIVFH